MFDLVLFDIDDTIFEFESVRRLALAGALVDRGVEAESADAVVARFLEVNHELWARLGQGEITLEFLRSERFRRPLADFGLAFDPEEILQDVYARIARDTTLVPGARELMAEIEGYAHSVALSNGIAEIQASRIKLAGLDAQFRALVTPEMVGAAKPSSAIFDFALSDFSALPRSRVLVVGDNLATDIAGARASGLRSCWLNRTGYARASGDAEPDFEIRSLAELPAIVRGEHPLVRFWRGCYGDFAQAIPRGAGFRNPHFPVPLMSPNFVLGDRDRFLGSNGDSLAYFNEIAPADSCEDAPPGFRLAQKFHLGITELADSEAGGETCEKEVVTLREALTREDFWDLLQDGFPRDAGFLRVLLNFLAERPSADFRTVFLRADSALKAIVSVGVANGIALTLNAVVHSSERGKGFSATLVQEAKSLAREMGATHAVFWTEHDFLQKHATSVHRYGIYERIKTDP